MEHDNTNRGALWVNDKKQTDKHPDLSGSLNVDGHEYWVSAWKKAQGANPKAPVLSFSIKRKDSVGRKAPKTTPNPPGFEDNLDDLPF